jgi:hypothetical protein
MKMKTMIVQPWLVLPETRMVGSLVLRQTNSTARVVRLLGQTTHTKFKTTSLGSHSKMFKVWLARNKTRDSCDPRVPRLLTWLASSSLSPNKHGQVVCSSQVCHSSTSKELDTANRSSLLPPKPQANSLVSRCKWTTSRSNTKDFTHRVSLCHQLRTSLAPSAGQALLGAVILLGAVL